MSENHWETFGSGNIVRWGEQLWIVEEVTKVGVQLISFSHSRMKAYITGSWPDEESERVQSIQYVTDNAEKLVNDCFKKAFDQFNLLNRGE